MMKTFAKRLLKYLPSKLLPALTGFITAPILTRLFIPAEYGNYALAAGLSHFLFALSCSGLGSGVIRFFPAYKVKTELGVFFATLMSSLGLAIGAVGAVCGLILLLINTHLPAALYPLLWISLLIFIAQSVFAVFMEVVRAQERSGLYTWLNLSVNYTGLGLGLFLVIVFGLRVDGLLWGTFLAVVLALPFVLLLTTRGVKIGAQHLRVTDTLQIWHYAWPLALGNMAMWGLRLSDRYIISLFRGASEVGLYSVAYRLSENSIDMVVALFMLSMGPMVMNTWESQGREATERALAMITRLYLILALPAVVGLTLLAFPLVALLTAKTYHEGYRIVGYVAFSSFAWGLFLIAIMGTLIKKQTHRIAVNQIIAAAVNLGLNLVLVPRFGFVAAGVTTLLGYSVLVALQAYASRPYLTWMFPFRTLRNTIIATACMGLAVWRIYALSGNTDGVNVGYLFLSIVVAILVYFASLLLLGEVTGEEQMAIKSFWYKVVGKTA